MTVIDDLRELHALLDQVTPDQFEEVRSHLLGLVRPTQSRFKVLRSFDGPETDLSVRARAVLHQETDYLLRSPANAHRLLGSYQEALGQPVEQRNTGLAEGQ